MWRMKVSAVIQKPSRSPSRSQCASNTSRSKRTWSVSVGVNAVKSCVPGRAAAQASRASRSRRRGFQWTVPSRRAERALRLRRR